MEYLHVGIAARKVVQLANARSRRIRPVSRGIRRLSTIRRTVEIRTTLAEEVETVLATTDVNARRVI